MKLEAPSAPDAFYHCPGPGAGADGAAGAVFRDTPFKLIIGIE